MKHTFRAPQLILVMLMTAAFALAPLSGIALASAPTAVVKGSGSGTMTEEGVAYPLQQFRVAGTVLPDGSANGRIKFVFLGEYPNKWGADIIHLTGTITSGSVTADGIIVFKGTSTEIDYRYGEGQVFYEVSAFEINVYDEQTFSLRWCALPTDMVNVTKGSLHIKNGLSSSPDKAGSQPLRATTSEPSNSLGCPR